MTDYLSPAGVRKHIAEIAQTTDDNEAAHAAEDNLWEAVLKAIAEDKTKDPAALAAAALETNQLDYDRWYA